ncbi:unnamed protein product [Prunus armeniaca]
MPCRIWQCMRHDVCPLLCLRRLHVNYGLDFLGVYLDSSLTDHEAKGLFGRHAEVTLHRVLSCRPALYQHIVNIDFHSTVNMLSENSVAKPLIRCPYIPQAERHDIIAIQSSVRDKCRIFAVGRVHEYLIVSRICIHEVEKLMTGSGVYELVDSGQRKAILQTCLVRIGIVLAHSPPTFHFPNHHKSLTAILGTWPP